MTPFMHRQILRHATVWAAAAAVLLTGPSCAKKAPADRVRVSGYVEATEVQVSAEVGGRLLDLKVAEGDRVAAGSVVAQIDTADALLILKRAQADREVADAQLRLLLAGARVEDVRQAEATRAGGEADLAAAREDLMAADRDLKRFESLMAANSGVEKQRDDAASRKEMASKRVTSAEQRVRASAEALNRLKAGARPEEIEAARARLASIDAQIGIVNKGIKDATVLAPISGLVTQKMVDQGELHAPGVPLVVMADLDNVWANVYLDEPLVPKVSLGQTVTLYTDAGGPGIEGKITFISAKAEFTPRNVQTADERSKLVFRLKVSVDNRKGVLKQGMPVEAEILFAK
ncbi:MAG: efflux RND transporter periplasmic adaptor subunit [Acidobacteria bacterium]|nr:efflux RND transporter periplasmic adaptor subunit [Acidobacteriota bacterium]